MDDPDPKVAEQAVAAVAEATRRYFKDDRAYPGVLRLLKSKRRFTRYWAIEAARWLRGQRCLEDVLPLIGDKAKQVRKNVLRAIIFTGDKKLNPRLRQRLLEAVLPILKDKDWDLRGSAATALREIGDRSHLDELKKALKKERDRNAKECLDMAIKKIEGRAKEGY